ncbi:MAG TPA: HD domain-containing phosphohydrolase [Vicinamibacteria bacterium]|nr:HD domain-containing phosphohydrolase [Vicinamibacteria bacterium]
METPPRVLVVDDDASFAALVAETLRQAGCEAASLTEPAAAVRRAAQEHPDAAFLDLVMPAMGGLELGDRIREASPETQIVILTGQGTLDSAAEGIRHGVFAYLQKSQVDLPRLERTAREAAERARVLRANRELTTRLQETNRLLQGLAEISATLAAEPHVDRVLDNLVRAARTLAEAATARAVLFTRSHSGELVIHTAVGDGAEMMAGTRLGPGEGLVSVAVESGAPVGVEDATAHRRYAKRADEMPTLLSGYVVVPIRQGSINGALTVAGRVKGAMAAEERDLLAALARHGGVALENAHQHERAVNFFTHTSDMLITVLEQVDVFYPGHSRAVAALADMVTRRLGLPDTERRAVHFAALLHDIGKIMVDPEVLRGERPSGPQADSPMREHPALGVELLKPITLWEDVLPSVLAHHERWDGTGYPTGQSGEEIPLGARVIAVADAFDAMTRETPHGPRRTPSEAIAELEACSGGQFDPRIVRLFVAEYRARGHLIPEQ